MRLNFLIVAKNILAKFYAPKMVFLGESRESLFKLCAKKRDDLDKRNTECRSQLYQNCPAVLAQSIREKIQQLNSKLFQYLYQIKAQKFTNLVGPPSNLEPPNIRTTN